jgi:hypothetical protein
MLSADEQEEIIRANREAFEELAHRWRDPQTGSPRPDLKQAVMNMVCDYFSAPGYSSEQLLKLISEIYDTAANEEDERQPIELTDENQIPDQIRAVLKRLGPDDDIPPGRTLEWDWDSGEWDWELSVRDTQADLDCGYVAIVPVKNGRRFEHRIKPPPSHQGWALRFVCASSTINIAIPDILIKGSLHEAKRRLDMLLGINTPEIPSSEEW